MNTEEIKLINLYLKKIKNGENDYIKKLHELIGPTLRYIALKYLKNDFDSDDLIQDFWVNIHKTAANFIFDFNGFSYLSKLMTRMAINRYNKIKHDRNISISYVDYSIEEDSNQDIDKISIKEAVNTSMKLLTNDEKIIIQLTYFEDKTVRQIGKELGISKTQVSRLLIRAKEKMKKKLEELLGDKIDY